MNVIALNPRSNAAAPPISRPIEAAGFHARQQRLSPTGLGVVVALHVAALGAVALVKGPQFIRELPVRTEVFWVKPEVIPPPDTPPPVVEVQQPRPTVLDRPQQVVQTKAQDSVTYAEPYRPPEPIELASGTGTGVADIPDVRVPVRVGAEFDPRTIIQPPYPPTEQRAQREGNVRVRVTIGADGRVTAVERLSATSDAFWRATERYALARWRFRPATEDGRPVVSTKVLNLHFQIEA
jgi:protein TonB